MPMNMDENSMAAGLLMGSGLREISQVLGLSRKKSPGGASASPDGAQPPAGAMAQGNMGDIDKIMMLAKMQGQMPGGGPPMPMPGGPPMGAPAPGLPGQPPLAPSPPLAPPPGGQAAPLPQPGAPLPPGMVPGGMPIGGGAVPPQPNPLMAALGGAAPGAGMGGSPLPMQLLQQLLTGSQGLV